MGFGLVGEAHVAQRWFAMHGLLQMEVCIHSWDGFSVWVVGGLGEAQGPPGRKEPSQAMALSGGCLGTFSDKEPGQ